MADAVNAPEVDSADARLMMAAERKVPADIRRALDDGADVEHRDVSGNTAIVLVADNADDRDDPACINMLIEHGASVNARNHAHFDALSHALMLGNVALATALIDAGADIRREYPLQDEPAQVEGDLHDGFWSGGNLLHFAADAGHPDAVQLVLDRYGEDLDVNACASGGMTPLHLAARLCLKTVCEMLIAAGADINQADDNGATPLYLLVRDIHVVIQEDRVDLVDVFIRNGADVNAAAEDLAAAQMTPLHIAMVAGNWDVARLLLEHGAKAHLVNSAGVLASRIADDIPADLQEAMARAQNEVGKTIKAAKKK